MKIVKQVAYGVGTALAVPVASSLVMFDDSTLDSPGVWLRSLIVGCVVSLGLYLRQRTPRAPA